MPKVDDPFYNRKPVPKEFIQDVGVTGLTPAEEFQVRERKYSLPGGQGDVRKFSNKLKPQDDPYYGRRRVSKAEVDGVGETGLSPEEEFLNRERKFSLADGSDARRFSNKFKPQDDPYYGRKQVNAKQVVGVGETGYTPAEEFEVRERKQSLFQLSSDPFDILSGKGHRQSISGAAVGAEATRRRSSAAVGTATKTANAQHHSGFDGDKLAPISSKPELPPVNGLQGVSHPGHVPTYIDPEHEDPDNVAPDETR